MKRPWLAALLNFFFMGAGYLYNGRRAALGVGWTLAALALTYVELNLQELDRTLWGIMFAAVFVANACFAVDGYREGRAVNVARDVGGGRVARAA